MPGLNRNDAYKKKVAIPNLQIQKEIVDKIEIEKTMIKNNFDLIRIYQQKIEDRINKVWGNLD